jgi:hypothetical protein
MVYRIISSNISREEVKDGSSGEKPRNELFLCGKAGKINHKTLISVEIKTAEGLLLKG